MRKEWLHRHRSLWAMVTLVLGGAWVLLAWLLGLLPVGAAFARGLLAGVLVTFVVVARQSPPAFVANWGDGALGEERTARRLTALQREGWVVLHDLANGSANFDHVVLGPNGVYCLNSKWSGYRMEVDEAGRPIGRNVYDDTLVIDLSRTVRRSKAEAAALSAQILQRTGQRVWVTPVVVWWGGVDGGGRTLDGVGVVEGDQLVARLRAQQGRPVRDLAAVEQALQPGRHRADRVPTPRRGERAERPASAGSGRPTIET